VGVDIDIDLCAASEWDLSQEQSAPFPDLLKIPENGLGIAAGMLGGDQYQLRAQIGVRTKASVHAYHNWHVACQTGKAD
jgi:hypothetical protein